MPKKIRILIAVVVLAGLAAAWWAHDRAQRNGRLLLSGNIETTEVELSFKQAGRVQERLADEGQPVRRGQVLARLDDATWQVETALRQAEVQAAEARLAELQNGYRPEDLTQAKAAQAQAEARLAELKNGTRAEDLAQAQARLAELKNGSRPEEIAQAQAAAQRSAAEAARAAADFARAQRLFADKVISTDEFEARQTQAQVTAASAAQAQAALALVQAGPRAELIAQAQSRLDLARHGPRPEEIAQAEAAAAQARAGAEKMQRGPRAEEIAQAQAALAAARQNLRLAQIHLADASLASPLDGLVLSKAAEPGEFVNPGTPVLTVADLDHLWLRAYVNLPDLGRVKLGQKALLRLDIPTAKPLEGRVSFIASEAEFTPKSIQTQSQRVKLVYRVKIEVPNPEHLLKPGMPADALLVEAD